MSEAVRPAFAADAESAEAPDYRPVAGLAVAGMLLGFASLAAFAGQMLLFLPFLAAGVSLTAMRNVSGPRAQYVGRKAAWLGLFLAVFSAAGGISQALVRDWAAASQTRRTADLWFEALQRGDPYTAHQLTLGPGNRDARIDRLPAVFMANTLLSSDIADYRRSDAVKRLLDRQGDFEFAPVRILDTTLGARHDRVSHIYRVTYEEDGQPQEVLFRLILARPVDLRGAFAAWRLEDVEDDYRPT